MLLDEYLIKLPEKVPFNKIRGVDCIYLINLDHCKDKLEYCKNQLDKYDIGFHRVPGVYGKSLPIKAFHDIGLKFKSNEALNYWCRGYCILDSDPDFDKSAPVKTYVDHLTTKGQIGCALSHLSILKDAHENNYQTIWVLEDDFLINRDPHCLSDAIEELDSLVGKGNWDVLYTDNNHWFRSMDTQTPAKYGQFRPDLPIVFFGRCGYTEQVGESKFLKIWGRLGGYSMILSRSGIERIVNFYTIRNLFHPYDREIAFIPDIKLYNLIDGPVSWGTLQSPSETVVGS